MRRAVGREIEALCCLNQGAHVREVLGLQAFKVTAGFEPFGGGLSPVMAQFLGVDGGLGLRKSHR